MNFLDVHQPCVFFHLHGNLSKQWKWRKWDTIGWYTVSPKYSCSSHFLKTGRITAYLPSGGPFVRMDSHVYPDYVVPPSYDSLLGKVCQTFCFCWSFLLQQDTYMSHSFIIVLKASCALSGIISLLSSRISFVVCMCIECVCMYSSCRDIWATSLSGLPTCHFFFSFWPNVLADIRHTCFTGGGGWNRNIALLFTCQH